MINPPTFELECSELQKDTNILMIFLQLSSFKHSTTEFHTIWGKIWTCCNTIGL